jgi:glucose-1-phosphate thymidylyltransferase
VSARKGIVLAGGSGTRLYPITIGVSKQLMPIYDKPMIYYPLSVLMLAAIRDIAIITTPQDQELFRRALGDGSQWGLDLTFVVQPHPGGLAQAYTLTETFLDGARSCMVLGDNIFFGHGLPQLLAEANAATRGGTIFAYQVADPERYGVVALDETGRVTRIIEKPEVPPSNYAVTGLYFLDGRAPEWAHSVSPSARGEVEIVSLLEMYLEEGTLDVKRMGRGLAWLDTGTYGSLLDAANFVHMLQNRQGLQIACLEEIAYLQGWIGHDDLERTAKRLSKNSYGQYLLSLLDGSPLRR